MSPCLVLDESSWACASPLTSAAIDAMEQLAQLLEAAAARHEPLFCHHDFYGAPVGSTEVVSNVLFSSDVERDLALRLQLAVDRAAHFDDREITSLNATFLGKTVFAPGVSWAHASAGAKRAVGVVPLPIDSALSDEVPVAVEGVDRQLHFVTTHTEHVCFYRAAIVFEGMDHHGIRAVAASAFPALEWLESAWNELHAHKRHFFGEHLAPFVRHLTVLNDHAAKFFCDNPGGQGVDKRFLAEGVDASNENGRTRSYEPAKKDRTRTYRGKPEVFWWHTKIRCEEGRIHFLHVPNPGELDTTRAPSGHIVIGICTDHCILPG